jgi:nicotinamidase-related amidase
MSGLTLDAGRSALLVMDFQTPIVENYATDKETLLAATAGVLSAARKRGMRVIYVVVGFRPGFPEIGDRNQGFARVKSMGGLSTEVHPKVAPQGEEPVVTKRRVGALHGTDLDVILRAHGIETLVMCGISTSGVVLSTLRLAADMDYRVVVLRDCCSDPETEVHACLMDKVFPRQATVSTSAEFIAAL